MVAVAVLVSCRSIFHERDAIAAKYHLTPTQADTYPEFYDLIEVKIKEGLILAVMQARASAHPLPDFAPSPTQQ